MYVHTSPAAEILLAAASTHTLETIQAMLIRYFGHMISFLWPILAFMQEAAVFFVLSTLSLAAFLKLLRWFITTEVFRSQTDALLHRTGVSVLTQSSGLLRHHMKDIGVPNVRENKKDSHPLARATRSAAVSAIHAAVVSTGRRVYSWSTSPSEDYSGTPGYRSYYWDKDIRQRPRFDSVTNDYTFVFTDVDYYVDMNVHLAKYALPACLYTVTPTECGGNDNNVSYCFLPDGQYSAKLDGGATYAHPLWDYSRDGFTAYSPPSWWSTASAALTRYTVDRVTLSPTRSIVVLTPVLNWRGVWALVAKALLSLRSIESEAPLRRFNPVTNVKLSTGEYYVRMTSGRAGSEVVNFGVTGRQINIPVSLEQDTALSMAGARSDLTARGFSHLVGLITANLNIEDRNIANLRAYILVEYYNAKRGVVTSPHAAMGTQDLLEYQTVFKAIPLDPDATCGVVPIAKPFGPLPTAPSRTLSNTVSGVLHRILVPNQDALKLRQPSKRLFSDMQAFTVFVLDIVGRNKLDPVSFVEVAVRQARPEQLKLVDDFLRGVEPWRETSHFVKQESSFGKAGDPRMISNVGLSKVPSARYFYALTDALKQGPFAFCFASGRDAAAIGSRVATIGANSVTNLLSADANRLDGTVNSFSRVLERSIMLGAFRRDYHSELDNIMSAQYGFCVRYDKDFAVDTMHTRASGSAETSVFNTLLTIFIAFRAYAFHHNGDYTRAWNCLLDGAVCLGDDTLLGDLPPRTLIESAASMGQKYEVVETTVSSRQGVEFLSRFYPNPFGRDPVNCAVLPRALAKLSIATRAAGDTFPNDYRLFQKCRALLVNDGQTPIISEIARKVVSLAKPEWLDHALVTHLAGWYALTESPYENGGEAEFEDYARRMLEPLDFDSFRAWLAGCKSIEEVRNCPGFWRHPAPLETKQDINIADSGPVSGSNPMGTACVFERMNGVCSKDDCKFDHKTTNGKAAARAYKLLQRRSGIPKPSEVSGDVSDDTSSTSSNSSRGSFTSAPFRGRGRRNGGESHSRRK